jgi:hypothetical protein
MTATADVRPGASLDVTAPPGWAVARVELVAVEGDAHLAVAADAVEGSLDDAVARHGRTLAEQLPGYTQEVLDQRQFAGREVGVRRYSWVADGEPRREQVELYRSGRIDGCVATLTTRDAPSGQRIEQVAHLVAQLSLHDLRSASRTYSVEELTLLAELFGENSFPGSGGHVFADESERVSARRALFARGTLRGDAHGQVQLDVVDVQLLQQALRPEAVVSVERRHPSGLDRRLVYVGRELTVFHTASSEGIHRFDPLATSLLAPALAALLDLQARPPSDAGGLTVPVAVFERAREAAAGQGEAPVHEHAGDALMGILTSVLASTHVRLRPARETGLQPAELIWLDAGDQGLWRILPRGDEVTLAPMGTEELNSELVALVVAGADQAAAASSGTGSEAASPGEPTGGQPSP